MKHRGMSSLEAREWARQSKAIIWWRGADACWVLVPTDISGTWRFAEGKSDIECALSLEEGRHDLVQVHLVNGEVIVRKPG